VTEAEWLNADSLYDMLRHFPAELSTERKLWLFGCACFRRQWHLLEDERTRRCVVLTERYVDGEAAGYELDDAWEIFDKAAQEGALTSRYFDTHDAIQNLLGYVDPIASMETAWEIAEGVGHFVAESRHQTSDDVWNETYGEAQDAEEAEQIKLLRDIFGNPFRPVTFSPSWRTDTAIALARQMYESRDFSAMPILADALQDAGCDNTDILSHCRDASLPHVRGCWVVDLVLAKS
jgi:hypothetical protein